MKNEEWIRFPDEGERCETTGLSRTSLAEILDEADPETGEKLILSMVKKKPGAKRGIRLINKQSLLDYLKRSAAAQNGLRWADHVANPDRCGVDEVLENRILFELFLGPDNHVPDEAWEEGNLSGRKARLLALINAGVLIRTV